MVSVLAEFASLEQLQRVPLAMEVVRTGLDPFDGMDDEVKLVELRAVRQEVSGNPARRALQNGGELRERDGGSAVKGPGGAAPQNDLLNGVARLLIFGQGL